jgi:hypothetical protein
MLLKIIKTIKTLDSESLYTGLNSSLYNLLDSYYGSDKYIKNLSSFYENKFDFYPDPSASLSVMRKALKDSFTIIRGRDNEIEQLNSSFKSQIGLTQKYKHDYIKKSKELNTILHSPGWKIIRLISSLFHKK